MAWEVASKLLASKLSCVTLLDVARVGCVGVGFGSVVGVCAVVAQARIVGLGVAVELLNGLALAWSVVLGMLA